MNERKNIDRLFQEKFKDFEVSPSEEIWSNIEAKLDKKKKRRVIPFWWKLSGIAAVFVIGFMISKSIYDDRITTENPIVNESRSGQQPKTTNSEIQNKKNLSNGDSIKAGDNPALTVNENEKANQKAGEGLNKNNGSNFSGPAIVNAPEKETNKSAVKRDSRKEKIAYPSKSAVAGNTFSINRSLTNKPHIKDNAPATKPAFEIQQGQLVAQDSKKNKHSNEKDAPIVQNEVKTEILKETQITSDQKPINLDDLKGDINSKIAVKETENKANDTTSNKSVAKNELEELLNEKESKLKKESKISRWQLASNVAPVFLGSASNGSPIDASLSKNSKSYNTNVGYGIGVGYVVNKKITIRTGLNKISMSYDTNDISFFTGLQSKTLANVDTNAASTMIHVESNVVTTSATIPSEDGLLPFEASISPKSNGYLRQEMGYLEMPLEMTYNLFDKKFGVKLIGGLSTFFLQDNNITIVSEGRDTVLGEASNLNDVHFSTNLGVGFKYSFLKSFEFNVEPTVKYQLNTFNANAGNFKPYLLGIYSGISYKF